MRGYLQEYWWWVIYWNGPFTTGYPTEKILLLSPASITFLQIIRQGWGLMTYLPLLHEGMLTCPILCLSFVGY